jgi:ABC-type branched-subunit amino acid transport system substrate-binding protein/sugar lactone lactonase YvrE
MKLRPGTPSALALVAIVGLLAACGPSITRGASPAAVGTPEAAAATLASLTPTAGVMLSPSPSASYLAPWYVEGVTVETYAGTGAAGYKDGPVKEAQFNAPTALAADTAGNLYVFDWFNYRIRRISPGGMVSTLAGTGEPGFVDGSAAQAQFRGIAVSLAVDPAGNLIVPDGGNQRIRLITPDGVVSTLAGTGEPGYRDGPADQAQFNNPTSVAMDAAGNVYVADAGNHRIRLITPQGQVRTLAGSGEPGCKDGPATEAQFDNPSSLTVDSFGNIVATEGLPWLFRGARRLRLITPDGEVTTLAGSGEPGHKDGPAAEARFVMPVNPAFDAGGNLVVADGGEARLRLVTPDGLVYTLAGTGEPGRTDGPGPVAQFAELVGVAVGPRGEVYVADASGVTIRRVTYGSPASVAPMPTATPSSDERIIKIGFALLRQGPEYTWLLNAARMAVDEANAAGGVAVGGEQYTLQLVVSPWCCGPEGAVSSAKWLIEQGVVAVVGYIRSEGALAASPVYDAAGLVHITPIAQDPEFTLAGRRTVYRVAPNLAYGAPIGARMVFEDLGIRRAALLVEPLQPRISDFQYTSAEEWQKAFEALGGQVFRHELTPESLADVLAAVRDEGAEAIITFRVQAWVNPGVLVQQIRETGVTLPIISVFSFLGGPAGTAAEGVYDLIPGRPTAAMPGYADFAAKYRAANLALAPEPLPMAPFGYDAMNLAIAAIRLAAETGTVTRASVAAAMETFRRQPYQGLTGPIQFDEFGDLLDQPVYFQKVVNGQWVDVMPGER